MVIHCMLRCRLIRAIKLIPSNSRLYILSSDLSQRSERLWREHSSQARHDLEPVMGCPLSRYSGQGGDTGFRPPYPPFLALSERSTHRGALSPVTKGRRGILPADHFPAMRAPGHPLVGPDFDHHTAEGADEQLGNNDQRPFKAGAFPKAFSSHVLNTSLPILQSPNQHDASGPAIKRAFRGSRRFARTW
jgi:hypothetical protein